MTRQLAFGSVVLTMMDPGLSEARLRELIMQAVKQTAMHEAGHTLGLRHNFKGSAWLSLDDVANRDKTRSEGVSGSIMDYLPVHFTPKDEPSGDFCATTIGPYDYWAIEYGYRPLGGGEGEAAELRKIASRAAEPALQYATDEQSRPGDPDPQAVRFDLGNDPVRYARQQLKLIGELLPGLADRMVAEGDGYQDARRAFNVLLSHRNNVLGIAARQIGGVSMHRDHRGDPNARPTFVIADVARQRDALALIEQEVLAPGAYEFPPEFYSRLAPNFWMHWGEPARERLDYPLHGVILAWQDRLLGQVLAAETLERIRDNESKLPPDQDAFTVAELVERLSKAVFQEADKLQEGQFTNRKPAITSLRRGLQTKYLDDLADLALGRVRVSTDSRTVALAELESLAGRLEAVLSGKAQLDGYTRAHLKQCVWRIRKVQEAQVPLGNP